MGVTWSSCALSSVCHHKWHTDKICEHQISRQAHLRLSLHDYQLPEKVRKNFLDQCRKGWGDKEQIKGLKKGENLCAAWMSQYVMLLSMSKEIRGKVFGEWTETRFYSKTRASAATYWTRICNRCSTPSSHLFQITYEEIKTFDLWLIVFLFQLRSYNIHCKIYLWTKTNASRDCQVPPVWHVCFHLKINVLIEITSRK